PHFRIILESRQPDGNWTSTNDHHPFRRLTPAKCQSGQFVPPEFLPAAQKPSRKKDSCRDICFIEDGFCNPQIVAVAIVEGDAHGELRKRSLLQTRHELAQRKGDATRLESSHLLLKAPGWNAQAPGVVGWLRNPVIHQKHRSRSVVQSPADG